MNVYNSQPIVFNTIGIVSGVIILASIWHSNKFQFKALLHVLKTKPIVKKPPKNRYIFIDIETTGLWHRTGDKIVEIACFYFDDEAKNGTTKKIFHSYVNPQRVIPAKVVEIHGISNETVKGAPLFSQIGQQLLDFIGTNDERKVFLVGHNIRKFDIPFINTELLAANLSTINNELFDTLEMYREQYPGRPAKLDDVCKMFDIDLSERTNNGHGALLDATLTAACFNKMMVH
jgi:DNA polymerase-3 subunit epsilon